MKLTHNFTCAGLNLPVFALMGGYSGYRVATRVATQLLLILLDLNIIFILVATVATKKTSLYARGLDKKFRNFGESNFLSNPMHGYMCFGGYSGYKGSKTVYPYLMQLFTRGHFCSHRVAVVATYQGERLENNTHLTQQPNMNLEILPEWQPEVAFLLRWFEWSQAAKQSRVRAVELLGITDYVAFPFLFGQPRLRQAYLLASWLSANSGVDFEFGDRTLRIVKHPIVEGVQMFGILSGAVQSGDEKAEGEATMSIPEAQEALGERQGAGAGSR